MHHSTRSATPSEHLRVLIVDDHPIYSDAMSQALEVTFPGCDVAAASTLKEAFETLDSQDDPDLVLFDLKLPDVAGISGFISLRKRVPNTRILVISSLASYDLVRSLMEEGANGFMPKDASVATLRYVVGEVVAGRNYVPKKFREVRHGREANACSYETAPELSNLTRQQMRILELICVGKPNKQIAHELSLAEATVKAHITALLRRLGVRNRTQAVVMVEGVMSRQFGSEPEARAFLQH